MFHADVWGGAPVILDISAEEVIEVWLCARSSVG